MPDHASTARPLSCAARAGRLALSIATAIATLSVPTAASAQQAAEASPSAGPATTAAIDSIVRAAVRSEPIAGVSIAVVRGRDTIVAKGYSYADLENRVPATAETVYRVGSVTKQFTAAAVMRLVEADELRLDDELTDHLPEYPDAGHRVTIRHLLNHTSGIKSYTELAGFWEKQRLDLSNEELIDLFAEEAFDFAPGDDYAYNNSGYYLLGVIIEKVTGDAYADHLRQRLFEPLGLEATRYCRNRPIIPNRAEGYGVEDGEFVNDDYLSMNLPGAAGALCSTALDLIAWSRALHHGAVVAPDSYERMTTPTTLSNDSTVDYGFGLGIRELEGHAKIAHGGGINGFSTFLAHYPEDDLSIAVLANTQGVNAGRIEDRIARRVLGVPAPVAESVPLPDDAARRYVGSYAIGELGVRVYEEDGVLMSRADGQEAFRLLYRGDDAFVAGFDDRVRLVFERQGERATGFVLHQGGQTLHADRVR